MKYICLIPARYQSSRFPGKPLAKIGGEEMILRVCRQVAKTGIDLAVATDDQRIFQCVTAAGFKAVMTSQNHKSGTERVEEAYRNLKSDADVIINVQGDEPFILPSQINKIKMLFEEDNSIQLATLSKVFDPSDGFDALFDPNLVKLTYNYNFEALYFSRSIIPYIRKKDWKNWLKEYEFHTHIGIYGYRSHILKDIVKLPASSLEKAESLEQLRWLQNGYKIKVGITEFSTIGIDTRDDLLKAEEMLKEMDNVSNYTE